MGSPISTGVLRSLRRLYQLAGGIPAVERLDEASPIQMVHDVSREAELGVYSLSRDGGWFVIQAGLTHAAADTQTTNFDPYTTYLATVQQGYQVEDLDLWVSRISVELSTVNFTSCNVSTEMPAGYQGGVLSRMVVPLQRWGSYENYYSSTGNRRMAISNSASSKHRSDINLPIRIPRGSGLAIRSTSSGILVTTASFLCFTVPRTTDPVRGI